MIHIYSKEEDWSAAIDAPEMNEDEECWIAISNSYYKIVVPLSNGKNIEYRVIKEHVRHQYFLDEERSQ